MVVFGGGMVGEGEGLERARTGRTIDFRMNAGRQPSAGSIDPSAQNEVGNHMRPRISLPLLRASFGPL